MVSEKKGAALCSFHEPMKNKTSLNGRSVVRWTSLGAGVHRSNKGHVFLNSIDDNINVYFSFNLLIVAADHSGHYLVHCWTFFQDVT